MVTYKLWRQLGYPPENTLHDLRWARQYTDKNLDAYVWVFLISGAAPAEHFGGYKNASSERQPPMYFRLGGGSLKGISKPGWIVWSRVFVDGGEAQVRHRPGGGGHGCPRRKPNDRWNLTTKQWPIMHAVLQGITRDQMMARHKSNHIQVVYAPDQAAAREWSLRQGRRHGRTGPRSRRSAVRCRSVVRTLKAESEETAPTRPLKRRMLRP